MGRLSLGRPISWMLIGFISLITSQAGRSADFERIKFFTFDKVEIHGTFYPSDKGPKAPCAILLHEIGGNSEKEGWSDLARKLQKEKGLAVLTFDFRGHGDSTNVDPDSFWLDQVNRTLKSFRPGKLKDQISYKDFSSALQFATMVNDIVAAKLYLDRRSEAGDCNSNNLVVLGGESGAALGALWVFDAWQRIRPVSVFSGAPITQQRREGEDIACGVWLTITPTLGPSGSRFTVPVDKWIGSPIRDKVPMYFLYGEQDTRGATYTKRLLDVLSRGIQESKIKLTGKHAIKDTKLAGRELLGKSSLGTEEIILKYVATVLESRIPNPRPKGDIGMGLVRVQVERLPLR